MRQQGSHCACARVSVLLGGFLSFSDYSTQAPVDEYVNDWKDDLMSIPAGTTLYQVYALDEPEVGYLTKIEAILSYHICIGTMN